MGLWHLAWVRKHRVAPCFSCEGTPTKRSNLADNPGPPGLALESLKNQKKAHLAIGPFQKAPRKGPCSKQYALFFEWSSRRNLLLRHDFAFSTTHPVGGQTVGLTFEPSIAQLTARQARALTGRFIFPRPLKSNRGINGQARMRDIRPPVAGENLGEVRSPLGRPPSGCPRIIPILPGAVAVDPGTA
jgi:hypothetical protein